MLYSVRGKLIAIESNAAVVECGGVGYMCQTTMNTLKAVKLNTEVTLYTYLNVREDAVDLFGFATKAELETFKNLISVSGVGPKAGLAVLSEQDLAPIRSGFRAKYILDAARRVAGGETELEKVAAMPMDEARAELQKIKGVGPKVAECALLYGFGRAEAFPVDVWVKRIMQELYPEGLPACTENVEGIAQQYLFHWRRNTSEND